MQNKNIFILIALAVVLIGVGIYFTKTNKNDDTAAQTKSESQTMNNQDEQAANQEPKEVAKNNDSGECARNFDPKNVPTTIDTKNKFVTLSVKNFGDIKIQLFDADAPKTVTNFLKLTQAGFYNCLSFHRIAKGFVIQGGDPNGNGTGGPGYTIPAEIKRKHTRGAVATARLGDDNNPKRDSSGSQFYIGLKDLPELDAGGYTVFGQVIAGMDVVDKIAAVEIEPGFFPG